MSAPELDPAPAHHRASAGLLCVLCGRHRYQDGAHVCPQCYQDTDDRLLEIAERFPRLEAVPGKSDRGGRGAPGFRSQAPGSVHVMAMRDRRSKHSAVRVDAECESDHPPLPVEGTLHEIVRYVVRERTIRSFVPMRCDAQVPFLRGHLSWLAANPIAGEAFSAIRTLAVQLRSATGEQRPKPIGKCIGYLDDDRPCLAPIFMPEDVPIARDERVHGVIITCTRCHLEYDGRRLVILRLEAENAARG